MNLEITEDLGGRNKGREGGSRRGRREGIAAALGEPTHETIPTAESPGFHLSQLFLTWPLQALFVHSVNIHSFKNKYLFMLLT